MNNESMEPMFYNCVLAICAVMAVVNATRTKTRGLSAIFLSIGFVVLGVTTSIYSRIGLGPVVYVGIALLMACLVGDAVYRIGRQGGRKP